MLQKVRETINENGLITKRDNIVVGVSGGPDSICLLHVLKSFQKEYELTLHVAHLNHMFRGAEAEKDAEFVYSLAREWGLPVTVRKADVPDMVKKERRSPQEVARRERYRFLWKVARSIGARKVAVGHHADDQAETVLMNFLRGSGLDGLKGMLPMQDGLIRPLLNISREDIEVYCSENKLTYREDASNKKTVYQRNKIRLQLIPLLEKEYNPGLRKNICKMANILKDEEAYLDKQTSLVWEKIVRENSTHNVLLGVKKFLSLPLSLQRRLLRRAYASLTAHDSLSYDHVEKVRLMAQSQKPYQKVHLPGKVVAICERGSLRFFLNVDNYSKSQSTQSIKLDIPGCTYVPFLKLFLKTEIIDIDHIKEINDLSKYKEKAYLDYHSLKLPLTVRTRHPGDRFQPLGLKGTKKIKDFLIDLKVPREERNRIPLVISGDEIAWLAGYRISHRFRVTSETKKVLVLTMSKYSPENLNHKS